MATIFRTAVVALALVGTSLMSGCMSDRDGRYGRDDRYRGERVGGAISVDFGNVAFGYRDGYWDNAHTWHQWGDDRHRESYRNYRGNHYNDWNHDRDGDDGWRRDNSR